MGRFCSKTLPIISNITHNLQPLPIITETLPIIPRLLQNPHLKGICTSVWLRGCVAAWLCGCVAAWLCGCVAVWLWCGCVAVWLRGCRVLCLCYCVAAWLCGCVLAFWKHPKRFAGGWKLKAGGGRLEVGGWKLEVGGCQNHYRVNARTQLPMARVGLSPTCFSKRKLPFETKAISRRISKKTKK